MRFQKAGKGSRICGMIRRSEREVNQRQWASIVVQLIDPFEIYRATWYDWDARHINFVAVQNIPVSRYLNHRIQFGNDSNCIRPRDHSAVFITCPNSQRNPLNVLIRHVFFGNCRLETAYILWQSIDTNTELQIYPHDIMHQ